MQHSMEGLVHLYVGDGKGKTTAAMGLAVRALGAGKRVLVVQFLKGQDTSELAPLRQLGIVVERTEAIKKFTFQMDDQELAAARADCLKCLELVKTVFDNHRYDLVVLDEVVDAVNADMFSGQQLVELIDSRPDGIEVVLTGRNPKDPIVELADYVTVMTALKHPYQRGVGSRRGIEY